MSFQDDIQKQSGFLTEKRSIGSVYYSGRTIGWSSCGCNADFEPGIVLDPFVGSGTTMKVALELGRNAIGVELNPKYVEIIKKRVPSLDNESIIVVKQ